MDYTVQPIPGGQVFIIRKRGIVLTWEDVIKGWLQDPTLRRLFDQIFGSYPGTVWETIPLAGLGVPFIMGLLQTEKYHGVRPDPTPILSTVVNPEVNVTTSLNNTGLLVIPTPRAPYQTMSDFALRAPDHQKEAFYRTLGETALEYLSSKILCWLTTNTPLSSWLQVKFNEDRQQVMPLTGTTLSYDLGPWNRYLPGFTIEEPTLSRDEIRTLTGLETPAPSPVISPVIFPEDDSSPPVIFPEDETTDPELLSRYRVFILEPGDPLPDLSSLVREKFIPRLYIVNVRTMTTNPEFPVIQYLAFSGQQLIKIANQRRVLGALYPVYSYSTGRYLPLGR